MTLLTNLTLHPECNNTRLCLSAVNLTILNPSLPSALTAALLDVDSSLPESVVTPAVIAAPMAAGSTRNRKSFSLCATHRRTFHFYY